jgi:hypothetical protein
MRAEKPYKIREFSLTQDAKGIRVFPRVPPGETAYLAVRCAVRPTDFSDEAIVPPELEPAVIQWVLFRAKMVDAENNVAVMQLALQHQAEFWTVLGVRQYIPRTSKETAE